MQVHSRLTVADLLALRGVRTLSMLRTETNEAAAQAAGIDLISIEIEQLESGDAVYCAARIQTVRRFAEEGIPVCGHVGLIPSKATWTGGFKAVGKTLDSAKQIWEGIVALQDAGAFAAEIEVVPEAIAQAVKQRSSLLLLGMGAGSGAHAQYLFSEDVLGANTGHVPRHAKIYDNFAAKLAQLQQERIAVYKHFAADVLQGVYPAPAHKVAVQDEVAQAFEDWLAHNAT